MSDPNSKNFDLSEQEFNRLAEALRDGDEELFRRTFMAQFENCRTMLQHDEKAPRDLAYDAVLDAMINFRYGIVHRKIKYGNLRYLLKLSVRQHYWKLAKIESRFNTSEFEDVPDLSPANNIDDELYQVLDHCWSFLKAPCKKLLRRIFYYGKTMTEIANQEGKLANTIRQQKRRCLESLRSIYLANS